MPRLPPNLKRDKKTAGIEEEEEKDEKIKYYKQNSIE